MDQSQDPALRLSSHALWKDDRTPLTIAGALLIGVGLVLGFVELALPIETLLLVAAAGALVMVAFGASKLSSVTLVAVCSVGTVWHAATPVPALTWALFACGIAGILHVAMHGRAPADGDDSGARSAWLSGGVAVLAASFAGYYQFVTLGFASGAPVRRVIITLVWMVTGIVGMALGGQRDRGMRDAGVLFVLVAIGKTLAYDVTHLGGIERLALLMLGGGALLVGARSVRPRVSA